MQGIVFDLDETLFDRNASVEKLSGVLWNQYLSNAELPLSQFIQQVVGIDQHGYVARSEFFDSMLRAFKDVLPMKNAIEYSFYDQVRQAPVVVDQVIKVLTRLREKNIPIGVVTNGGTIGQKLKLENSGLQDLIDVVVISGEFGVKKPDPTIYIEAASKLDIDVKESWFVGDNSINDVWGSKQVGFKSAWIALGRQC